MAKILTEAEVAECREYDYFSREVRDLVASHETLRALVDRLVNEVDKTGDGDFCLTCYATAAGLMGHAVDCPWAEVRALLVLGAKEGGGIVPPPSQPTAESQRSEPGASP